MQMRRIISCKVYIWYYIRNNSNVTSGLQSDSKMQITSSMTILIAVAIRACSKNSWVQWRLGLHPVYVSYTIFDGGELCAMKQSSLFSHIHLETIQRSMTGQSTLHVKTVSYKLIVSVIFTTGTFYETSDIFSLRQKRQL